MKKRKSDKVKNFHPNFVNLNRVYEKQKYKRDLDMAKHWEVVIQKRLKNEIEEKHHQNFIEFVKNDGKLSYEELRQLNDVWK